MPKLTWKGEAIKLSQYEYHLIKQVIRKQFEKFTIAEDIGGLNSILLKMEGLEARVLANALEDIKKSRQIGATRYGKAKDTSE